MCTYLKPERAGNFRNPVLGRGSELHYMSKTIEVEEFSSLTQDLDHQNSHFNGHTSPQAARLLKLEYCALYHITGVFSNAWHGAGVAWSSLSQQHRASDNYSQNKRTIDGLRFPGFLSNRIKLDLDPWVEGTLCKFLEETQERRSPRGRKNTICDKQRRSDIAWES